jgi:threonine dehydrogenase-like Zn-dependent dehydrogenase
MTTAASFESAAGIQVPIALERQSVIEHGSQSLRGCGLGRVNGGRVLFVFDSVPGGEVAVPATPPFPLPDAVDDDTAMLVPAVATVLSLWDLLELELGERAVVTGGHPWSDLAAAIGGWYGANPVFHLSDEEKKAPSSCVIGVAAAEFPSIVKTSAAAHGGLGVAVVELSGRAEMVDLLLENIPPFSRLVLAGDRREQLTIDFYLNVHRKGFQLVSRVPDPAAALDWKLDPAVARRLNRACRMLMRKERAEECRTLLSNGGLMSASAGTDV